jgi:hypothetical protein
MAKMRDARLNADDYLTRVGKHEVDKSGFYPLLQIHVFQGTF